MKDEEFINKRKPFGKFTNIIFRNQSYYVGKHLEKYNLNKSEYKYLIQVYEKEGVCQDDIVNILKVDKYEVAKGVKSLIEKGYIYKEKDEIDKRKHRLYITEKGKSIKTGVVAILEETSKVLTKGFSEKEKDMLLGFLIRMVDNICEETMKLKK